MNKEKEQWTEEVLQSMHGSLRAIPSKDLFARIEKNILLPEAKLVSMSIWRMAAAAAAVLLFLNIFAFQSYAQKQDVNKSDLISPEGSQDGLISNYNYYN